MNKQVFAGLTALIVVAGEGHHDWVNTLIQVGADVNIQCKLGYEAMLPKKDGETTDDKMCEIGYTALMVAAATCHDNCVESLLHGGADVNIRDQSGYTVDNGQCVHRLLIAGTRINHYNLHGNNTLESWLIFSAKDNRKKVSMSLYAAGKTIDEIKVQVPDYLKPEYSLKHLCKETIRKHLLVIDPHLHLFLRIPQLEGELPCGLLDYLL